MGTPRGTWLGFPMVVLVDGATASAAEIVPAPCKITSVRWSWARRLCKGSVQTVMTIEAAGPNPAGLSLRCRATTRQRPSIQSQGITPNVVVEATAPAPTGVTPRSFRERNMERHLRNAAGEKPESGSADRTPIAGRARLPKIVGRFFQPIG